VFTAHRVGLLPGSGMAAIIVYASMAGYGIVSTIRGGSGTGRTDRLTNGRRVLG